MDDLNRAPGESDRKSVRDRITRAVAEGKIGSVDGDIRLTNVKSAQSLTELSLIARDLDQLDAAQALAARAAVPVADPAQPQVSTPMPAAAQSSGRLVPLLILGLVFALVVAGGVALFVFSSNSGKDEIGDQPPIAADRETPVVQTPGQPASADPGADPEPASTAFELSSGGVKSFFALYQQKFSTTKVVDLTMYDNYAIARVPVAGKNRNSGWLYREGAWTDFGGVSANFPGSASVDLRKLDVAAMMRNIGKARRTLNVEDYNLTYVTISYRPDSDPAPNVNIYVSNEFRESGYLATNLDGSVERAYPYSN